MEPNKVNMLASYMKMRLATGQPPYNFFLGAGASVPSAYPTAAQFVDKFLQDVVGIAPEGLTQEEKRQEFNQQWQLAGDANTTAFIKQTLPPSVPSTGYALLSMLARSYYVSNIITTNVDSLVDQAISSGQADPGGYQLLSHPLFPVRQITYALSSTLPRIKVLKLHGDLFSGMFLFTDKEMASFPAELARVLGGVLQRDTVFCGYGFGDQDVRKCLRRPKGSSGPSVFSVAPNPPDAEAAAVLADYAGGLQLVTGATGDFDEFMTQLAQELGVFNLSQWTTFDSKFDAESLEGVASLNGPLWTEPGHVLIGDVATQGVVQVGQLFFGEARIDIKGQFIAKRGESDWFGISSSRQTWPHLVYVRTTGTVEILGPPYGSALAVSEPGDVAKCFHLRVLTTKRAIVAELLDTNEETVASVVKTHSDQERWNGGLFLHTFFAKVKVSSVTVRPL